MTQVKPAIPEERFVTNKSSSAMMGNDAGQIVYPESEDEIVEVMKFASRTGKTVIPVGGNTKKGFGGTAERADILLSLERLQGITEHRVGDLTVSVKAGTTIARLAAQLAESGQKIPLDPFWPAKATIGGVIAANDSGPKRLKYGSARDSVIGLRVVYPNGKVIRTGGKVVKNVAGYDMNKLFIGSMGTLGVISEITLKLRPIPRAETIIPIFFSSVQTLHAVRTFIGEVVDSSLEPAMLEFLNPGLSEYLFGKKQHAVIISFEGTESAVADQEKRLFNMLPPEAELGKLSSEEARDMMQTWMNRPPAGEETDWIALKTGTKNLDVITVVTAATALGEEEGVTVEAHGGAGVGLTRIYLHSHHDSRLLSFAEKLRRKVEDRGGYLIATHMPLALRRTFSVWGRKPAYFRLLEGIKKSVDSQFTLNPGRFVGGL